MPTERRSMHGCRVVGLAICAALAGCSSCAGARSASAPARPATLRGSSDESASWPGSPTHRLDGPSISASGRVVVFETEGSLEGSDDVDNTSDVYAYDVDQRRFTLVSITRGVSSGAIVSSDAVSADGRVVAYAEQTFAEGAGGTTSVLVRDRIAGVTTVVWSDASTQLADVDAPSISADGRVLAWAIGRLDATERVLVAEVSGAAREIWLADAEASVAAVLGISADGSLVLYATGREGEAPTFWVADRAGAGALRGTPNPIRFAHDGLVLLEPSTGRVTYGTVEEILARAAIEDRVRAYWLASRSGESFAILHDGRLTAHHGSVVRDLEPPAGRSWTTISIADDGRVAAYVESAAGACVVVAANPLSSEAPETPWIPLACTRLADEEP